MSFCVKVNIGNDKQNQPRKATKRLNILALQGNNSKCGKVYSMEPSMWLALIYVAPWGMKRLHEVTPVSRLFGMERLPKVDTFLIFRIFSLDM